MRKRGYVILVLAVSLIFGGASALVAYDQAGARRDAAELLQLDCETPEWLSVTNELDETEASPYATEEEALLAEWNRLFPKELPEGTGVVTTDAEDGFMATHSGDGETEYVLVVDEALRARATVTQVEAGGYVVGGLTKC